MPRNVEVKARVSDASRFGRIAERAMALATAPVEVLTQDDTFYACAQGRLKLRVFGGGGGDGELIVYRRADVAGPKTSTYRRVPVAAPKALGDALAEACGVLGRVRKRRQVVLAGRTRIHLDEVEGLGQFIELEVVLRDGEPECDGLDEAEALMTRLGLRPEDLVEGAYVDLTAASSAAAR